MKKSLGFFMAVAAALVLLLSSVGSVFACTVEGDFVTPGTYPCAAGDLWTLLENTGGGIFVPSTPPPPIYSNVETKFENYVEGDFVLVSGKFGSSALYSVGQLNPSYGPADAVTITLDKCGRYDLAGEGQAVENVSSINVVHGVNVIKGQGTHFYSTRLVVSGEGIIPKSYDLADLEGMVQATFTDPSTGTVYTGPTLLSILKALGIDTMDMDSYVVVSATDAYATVLSMYELTHETGTQYDMLAISATDNSINGTVSGSSDNGFARLVLPGDNTGAKGRWVSNADEITVYKVTPQLPCSPFSGR